MKRLLRILLPATAALTLGSCSLLQSAVGEVVSSPSMQQALAGTLTSPEAKAFKATLDRCENLQKLPITLKEELAFGGAMAVGVARQGSGLYLDVKGSLDDVPKGKKLTVAATPANDLTRYLDVVGKNLAAQSSRPTLPWTLAVINSDSLNAFSAPGGYVFVTRGLLRKMKTEAQLAGVLAHEIGHVTQGHALGSYRATKATQCKLGAVKDAVAKGLGDVVKLLAASLMAQAEQLSPNAAGALRAMADEKNATGFIDLDNAQNFEALRVLVDATINTVVSQGYGRESEFSADTEAQALLVNAGYNPNEYIAFLSNLPDGGLFSTHPSAQERQKLLQDQLRDLPGSELRDPSHPFDTYAVVPLKNELAAAAK